MKRPMKIAGISLGALVVVAVLVITIAGGAFMPKNYLEPWEKTYHQKFDDPGCRWWRMGSWPRTATTCSRGR